MTLDATPHDPRLERMLDGLLAADEVASLERDLARLPALRAELEELRRIDASLRDLFTPSIDAARSPARTPRRSRRIFVIVAAAACLAMLGTCLWWFLRPIDTTWAPRMFAMYRAQEEAGFVPQQVCNTRGEFMLWTTQAFQRTLAPDVLAPGIQWVGWNKDSSFSNYTGILLTKVDGVPVIVVLDPNAPSRVPRGGLREGNLHLFARDINGVGAIEITPLDHQRVLNAITPG